MTQTAEELKPCPFCAQEQADGMLDIQPFTVPFSSGPNSWSAGCYQCGTIGPAAKTERMAVKAWNTRTPAKEAVK